MPILSRNQASHIFACECSVAGHLARFNPQTTTTCIPIHTSTPANDPHGWHPRGSTRWSAFRDAYHRLWSKLRALSLFLKWHRMMVTQSKRMLQPSLGPDSTRPHRPWTGSQFQERHRPMMASKGSQSSLNSSVPSMETQKGQSSWYPCGSPRSETTKKAETCHCCSLPDCCHARLPRQAPLRTSSAGSTQSGSKEQTAWINVVTPTVRQCKAESADKLQKT